MNKEMNTKQRIQKQINHWLEVIDRLEEEINTTEMHTKEWECAVRSQREYKGRVYAARFFDDVLGFEFDTNFATF